MKKDTERIIILFQKTNTKKIRKIQSKRIIDTQEFISFSAITNEVIGRA